jgi:hypothetical protein
MPAPVASGWSGRRVGLAPTGKAPPCHGARGKPTIASSKLSAPLRPRHRDRTGTFDPKRSISCQVRIGLQLYFPRS